MIKSHKFKSDSNFLNDKEMATEYMNTWEIIQNNQESLQTTISGKLNPSQIYDTW